MPSTLPDTDRAALLLNSAIRPRQAKVHTLAHGNPANNPGWVLLGECLDEVRGRLTVDEFAGLLERDARQVGKWLKGQERPQIDVVIAVEQFQKPLVLAMARRVRALRVRTLIEEVA